jgi:hypothetical protein
MALYIENSGRVERYLVFSPDRAAHKVCIRASTNQSHVLIHYSRFPTS